MIQTLFNLIRAIVGIIDLLAFTVIVFILSFIPNKIRGQWFLKLINYWLHIFIRALRVDLFVHEKNHNPLPKQYIVIANHPSCFEDFGMAATFGVKFLAKKEVRHWFLIGRLSYAVGTLYVDRDNKQSRNTASDSLLAALKSGDSIGLYPEGGCISKRIHLPFQYGAFNLSMKSDVPILPVFLHYEAQERFEWTDQHLIQKLWTIFTAPNRRVNYYVYDAIYPSQFNSKEEYCKFVEQLYLKWQSRYLD